MVSVDRFNGLTGNLAIKTPVRVATTANITLSGTQTIDGVAVVADDRVLVKDQTTASENGIYICAASSWSRSPDFDGNRDVVDGTLVPVTDGTVSAGYLYSVSATNPITINTTSLTFSTVGIVGGLGTMSTQNASAVAITGGTATGLTNVGTTKITDTNGNELILFTTTASAVNELTVTNAATGSGAILSATGGDTNIDINLQTKGTGVYNHKGTATSAAEIRLFEDTDNGTNYVGLKAKAAITGNTTWVLPETDVTNGYWKSDGSGNITLATVTSPSEDKLCQAWVSFNGTGTPAILDSYNVTSLTDNGTGDYTINITSALANANYAIICGGESLPGSYAYFTALKGGTTPTTTACRVMTYSFGAAAVDPNYAAVALFGA